MNLMVISVIAIGMALPSVHRIQAGEVAAAEFIVQQAPVHKKKLSLNALKEQVGDVSKNLFEATTLFEQRAGDVQCSLATMQGGYGSKDVVPTDYKNLIQASALCNAKFGTMQKDLALLQRKCSSIIEKLIDDAVPFKKVSKKVLEKTSECLVQTREHVNQSVAALQQLDNELKKHAGAGDEAAFLHKLSDRLQKHVQVIKQVCAQLAADECLQKA